jgi:hypothetical protein
MIAHALCLDSITSYSDRGLTRSIRSTRWREPTSSHQQMHTCSHSAARLRQANPPPPAAAAAAGGGSDYLRLQGKVNYNMLSDRDLRRMVRELGLPDRGDRRALVHLHRHAPLPGSPGESLTTWIHEDHNTRGGGGGGMGPSRRASGQGGVGRRAGGRAGGLAG